MNQSPLRFAQEFEKLKGRLRTQPAADLRLLELVLFWPSLARRSADRSYRSYFDEYIPAILDHTAPAHLMDLRPHELTQLLEALQALGSCGVESRHESGLHATLQTVALETARKFFYVGATWDAVRCLALASGADSADVPPEIDAGGWSEIDALRSLVSRLESDGSRLAVPAQELLRDWEVEREALSFEEANCLFVEKSAHGDHARGRMGSLQGRTEYRRRGAQTDEVTFESQLKAPDDPFVGVVYDALKAVRTVLGRTGVGVGQNGHVRARFGIAGGDHTFTGDSIGLAAGLVAYTQLLKPEILKHERFLACEAVFTGGVDRTGRLTPVNEVTLPAKVERAFFSPIRYLVLPKDNLDAAQECVEGLQRTYPNRRLLLVGASTLADVIDNRNIVRAEKVCMGQFVTRRVVKYTRATKIQVPILLAMLYALVCLIYPKAWVGFDWNPKYVRVTERGFDALNADSVLLWEKIFDCDSLVSPCQWTLGNLDSDWESEILFSPKAPYGAPCTVSGYLYAFDDSGDDLFVRDCCILGQYPGDSVRLASYNIGSLRIVGSGRTAVIMTTISEDFPSRTHIRLWSSDGDSLGWYIHAGSAFLSNDQFSGAWDSCFIFIGTNSRMGCVSLFVLPRDSFHGVSPPYSDHNYPGLAEVTRGNQLQYILFPPSDLSRAHLMPYNEALSLFIQSQSSLSVITGEGHITEINKSSAYYRLNRSFRVTGVTLSDEFYGRRDSVVRTGDLEPALTSTILSRLHDTVTYWTDSGWISEHRLRADSTARTKILHR